jgi:hypothetical protein
MVDSSVVKKKLLNRAFIDVLVSYFCRSLQTSSMMKCEWRKETFQNVKTGVTYVGEVPKERCHGWVYKIIMWRRWNNTPWKMYH